MLLFSVVALIVIVGALAGGIYLWVNSHVHHLPNTGQSSTSVSDPVPEPPDSTDILLLGSDSNPNNAGNDKRSDTVMLVHVDRKNDYLGILSLPRDLYVDIPGHGKGKLNSAYAESGWELTKQTVEQLTSVPIEHCIVVDFNAFKAITDAVGGVYLDVDHRYYQDNPEWELAKLSPGYQRLDGANALDWVRFRHDLNMDFGRMERQQRFLTALREQAMGWNLVHDLPGMVSGLLDNLYVDSGLGTTDLIRLAYWGIKLNGSRIKQVSLIGDIQDVKIGDLTQSVVVAATGAVQKAVQQLVTAPATTASSSGQAGTGSSESSSTTSTTAINRSDFTTNLDAIENSKLWKEYAAAAPFKLMAPGYLPKEYAYVDKNPPQPGTYNIDIGGGKTMPALKMVYRYSPNGEKTDQYMGIMETTWLDAPAASKGIRQVQYNGITYTIVGTSQNTDHVWWKENGVLYWVSNTLSYYLNWKELLKVAESMMVVPSGAAN